MSEGEGLPEGWVACTLGEVCDVSAGVGFPNELQGQRTGDYPFFKVGDISEAWQAGRKTLVQAKHYVSEDDLIELKARPLRQRSIVFAKIGAAISLNRRAILGQPSLVDNNCMALWASAKCVAPDYLFYFTCTLRLGDRSRASVVPSLRKSDVEPICFPLPPLPEQHRIVAKIEELFSDLDAGVQNLKRAKANLKRYRASVLKAAVEGRLTQEWREANPQEEDGQMLLDRILRERRAKWEQDQLAKFREKGKEPPKNWQSKYKEPAEPDVSELPELPEGWVWATVDVLTADALVGLDCGREHQMTSGTGSPYIKMNNITMDGRVLVEDLVGVPTNADQQARFSVRAGDLLFNTRNSVELVGKIGLVRAVPSGAVYNNNLMRLRVAIVPAYMCVAMCSIPFRSLLSRVKKATTSVAAVYAKDLFPLAVPLPPLAEQEQIVALVEENLYQIDSAEKTINSELIRSKRLRQSILKRAFEGKLVPQDPKDEPACVLLERIKASRDAEQPKKKSKKATK